MKKNANSWLIIAVGKISSAIALGLLLVGCNARSNYLSQSIEINEDIERVPFEALQKILELGKQSRQTIEDIDSDRDNYIEPISFRELINCLPETPAGWSAEKPYGKTTSFGDYSVSQVKQTYFRRDKQMTVSIFDWAFNSALYLPFLLSTELSHESTEGYSKGVKIDNVPGREDYDYYTKDGSLNLLINRRFLVRIDGNNIEEIELKEWWESLDRDTLESINSR